MIFFYALEVTIQEWRALSMPEGTVSRSAGILLYLNPTAGVLLLQKNGDLQRQGAVANRGHDGSCDLVREFESMDTQPVQIEVDNLVPGMYQTVLKEAGGKTWSQSFRKQ